jgi:hypothetical protein
MDTRLIFRDYFYPIKTDAGTQTVSRGEEWFRTSGNGDPERQIRRVDCQEKPLRRMEVSVPQTDTGGRDEYSKALG